MQFMNLILENTDQVQFFTNMREIFFAAEILVSDFDWYISDVETNLTPDEFSPEDRWMSGEELAALIQARDIQFIYAVFSALPKDFRPVCLAAPSVSDNRNYWSGADIAPHLEGALFEIVCWDSSATILINLPDDAQHAFVAKYSDTRPLHSLR